MNLMKLDSFGERLKMRFLRLRLESWDGESVRFRLKFFDVEWNDF